MGVSAEFGSCHVFSKRSPPAGLARPADMVPWGRPDPSCHGEEVCARHPDPHGFGKKDDLANVFGQRFGDWPVAGRNGGLYPSMGRGAAEENRAPMRWTSGRLYLRYALLAEDLFFNGVSARLSSLESGNVTPTCLRWVGSSIGPCPFWEPLGLFHMSEVWTVIKDTMISDNYKS